MEDDGESEESTKIRLKQFGKTKKLEYCKRIVSETNKENGVKGKVFCAKLLLAMRNGSYTTIPNEGDYGSIHGEESISVAKSKLEMFRRLCDHPS